MHMCGYQAQGSRLGSPCISSLSPFTPPTRGQIWPGCRVAVAYLYCSSEMFDAPLKGALSDQEIADTKTIALGSLSNTYQGVECVTEEPVLPFLLLVCSVASHLLDTASQLGCESDSLLVPLFATFFWSRCLTQPRSRSSTSNMSECAHLQASGSAVRIMLNYLHCHECMPL